MTELRLGMKEWHESAIKLKFSNYIDRSILPTPPRVYGHVRRNDIPWQMLANNRYGNCVLAGAAHEVMTWALATQRSLPLFNDETVVNQYLALTGGKDEGLDPVATAKWRATTGLKDADGVAHRIKAFATVDDDADLDIAAYVFGVCGVGFLVPNTAMKEFNAQKPWTDTSERPNPARGHYVPLVGRNSKGMRMVVTWGRLQAVSDAWWQRYFVGAVAYFSLDYLLATGFSPEGIDEARLDRDLQALA